MFQELMQQYSSGAARETLLDSWRAPAGVDRLHMVGVALTGWDDKRRRLQSMGERLADDEKTKCDSLVALLGGHALTRKIVASLKLQHGRGIRSGQIIQRMLIDTEYWEQEWQHSRSEPKEANAAVLQEQAVAQVEAFVATSGESGKKGGKGDARRSQQGKGSGGDRASGRGQPGYGHCIEHQFNGECKRERCPYIGTCLIRRGGSRMSKTL